MGRFLQKNLSVSDKVLTGLVSDLLEAASHQSYVETFSGRADSWHRGLKFTTVKEWFDAFCQVVKSRLPRRLRGKIWLAIDITEDAYYGEPTLDTVPWTGEDGITAWWEFIVLSLVESSTKKTIPLAALPFKLGTRIELVVEQLLDVAMAMLPRIDMVLFDRGFYSGELISLLNEKRIRYLMLVAKNALVKPMADQCRYLKQWAVVPHTLTWNADKSTQHTDTNLVFFPAEYDWSWATNVPPYHISSLVRTYRTRWRIETLFRVQDEARVKSKSRSAIVRYVTFLVSLLLTTLWSLSDRSKPFKWWLAAIAKLLWLEQLLTPSRMSV